MCWGFIRALVCVKQCEKQMRERKRAERKHAKLLNKGNYVCVCMSMSLCVQCSAVVLLRRYKATTQGSKWVFWGVFFFLLRESLKFPSRTHVDI